jgi:hypothetical protein
MFSWTGFQEQVCNYLREANSALSLFLSSLLRFFEKQRPSCNVRGRGSLSHYLVYSESPPRWCSLAIILPIYLHHNLLPVSNRSIQNTYRLVTLAVLTLLSLSCSLERFAFEYYGNLSKNASLYVYAEVTPEFQHHL